MEPRILYKKEVEEMLGLLREAAKKEILPRWGRINAKQKGTLRRFKDIVTEADTKASEYILSRIRTKFPGSYSEEQKFPDRFDYDLIWQIDPLDGTQEFCEEHIDGFASHAALLKRNKDGFYLPVAGIIYLPGVDKLWYNDGSSDVVHMVEGINARIPEVCRHKLIGYVREVDPDDSLTQFYHDLGRQLGLKTQVVPRGGAGASISDLLEGKINLIIMNYDYTKEWDLSMAEPIIRTRGGFICDFDGHEFTYNRKDSGGLGEPYNLRGYVISIAFKKEEIVPHIPKELLVNRL